MCTAFLITLYRFFTFILLFKNLTQIKLCKSMYFRRSIMYYKIIKNLNCFLNIVLFFFEYDAYSKLCYSI